MAEERFVRWEPVGGLAAEMMVEAMRDDREGFRLILREAREAASRALRIAFDEPVCFRAAQDRHFVAQMYERHEMYPWPIFVVENSRYQDWFYTQTGTPPDRRAKHYHIAAAGEIIDVIAERPPVVSWLGD